MEDVVQGALDGGLLESSRGEIEELLGQGIQRSLLAGTGSTVDLPAWAEATFGPASLARRFVEFHRMAIAAQICSPEGGGLKAEYARALDPGGARAGGLTALATALASIFEASTPEAAGAGVAVYASLWILHADLQEWCRACRDAKQTGAIDE